MANESDPICGNCGNKKSSHYFEKYGDQDRKYCYVHTNGDVWTSEPSDADVAEIIAEKFPQVWDEAVRQWKAERGHPVLQA